MSTSFILMMCYWRKNRAPESSNHPRKINGLGEAFSALSETTTGKDAYVHANIPHVLADGDPLTSSDLDVDGKQLAAFIAEFRSVNRPTCQYDLDTDGDVDTADLSLFSEDFGRTP